MTDVEPLCSLTVQSLDPHRSSPQQSGQRRSQNMVTNFVLCLSFIFFFCLFVLDIFYQNKRSIEYGIALHHAGSCAFLYFKLYPYSTKTREILEIQSPTPMRFPEGKARRKSRGSREISRAEWVDFTIPTEFWWITDILLIINPSTGMDQEIHPSIKGKIE